VFRRARIKVADEKKKKKLVDFKLDKTPPSLNVMLRQHWTKLRKEQRVWDLMVVAYWLTCKKVVFKKPVKITYIISFKVNRGRDFDNYIGGTKFITDALKRTFLTDDSHEWLKKIEIGFMVGRESTRVRIEEVD
jgi:hypothetical protein